MQDKTRIYLQKVTGGKSRIIKIYLMCKRKCFVKEWNRIKKNSSKKWLSNPIVFDLVQKVDELMLKLRPTDFQFAALRDFQFASGRAYRSITFFSLKGNRDFNMLMKDIQAGWLTDQLNCFFLEESILNKNLITEHMQLHQKACNLLYWNLTLCLYFTAYSGL